MASFRAVEEYIANRILLSLPQATLERMQPALELVKTARDDVIDHADRPIEYVYFVNRGLISLVMTMKDGRTVEVGVVGIEGVTNAHALFGFTRAPLEAMVQVPGSAFRIKRTVLKDIMVADNVLREALEKYSNFALLAFAQTAACNRLHRLEERCCRWLLIAHDSARSDTYSLTQEFLAMMLGVQRPGVSITASALQKAGLIEYRHGQVTITNRSGLEDTACECYRTMSGEFDKIFPVQEPMVSAQGQPAAIARLNIEEYRQRLTTEQDEATRQRIVQLLAKEEARLAALSAPPREDMEKESC